MSTASVFLVNSAGQRIAALDVQRSGDEFVGRISLDGAPPPVRKTFDEFEEVVEGQTFSLLNTVETRIADLQLAVQFDDGPAIPVIDLQVFPSTGAVSFKIREPVAA